MGTRTSPAGGVDSSAEASPRPPDRKCGRCQQPFAGDPALHFQTDWALCPACDAVLLPHPVDRTRP